VSKAARQATKRKDKFILACVVSLVCAGLLVWGNTLRNGFVYDDETFIVANPGIRTLTPLTKFFAWETSAGDPQMSKDVWRPLTTFSSAVNYQLFELNPVPYHLVNVVLHIINALLVFWLVILMATGIKRKEKERKWGEGRGAGIVAFITAAIFLLHPGQVETVAWIAQRSNLLFLFFYLLSFILILKRKMAFSLIAFACSLLAKEMALSLPLVLLAYFIFIERKKFLPALYQTLPYFLVLLAFVLARSAALGQVAQTGYWAGGFVPQMLTMVKGFAYYVKLMFLPYPLSIEYLFPVKNYLDAEVVVYGLLLAGIIYFAWRAKGKYPLLSFGVFLFFLSLVPVSNILPIRALINERFLYSGVIGFGLVVGAAALELGARRLKLIMALLIVLALIYGAIDLYRNLSWQDNFSCAEENLKTCPQSASLHYGMGRAYAERGMYDRAIGEFKLALEMDPEIARALLAAGIINEIDPLAVQYREALQKSVKPFDGLNNLGTTYLKAGDYRQAALALALAVDKWPAGSSDEQELLNAKSNLSVAYAYSGDLRQAIALCRELLARNPGMEKTRRNLELFTTGLKAH
jgi:protein O-mannosyl-transferase